MKKTALSLLPAVLIASCAIRTDNEYAVFDDEPSADNIVRISGLEGPPQVIEARASSVSRIEEFTGRQYIPAETVTPEDPGTAISVPAEVTEVLLTLVDVNSGAIKKIASSRGLKDIRLTDVPDGTYMVMAEAGDGFRPPQPKEIVVRGGRFESFELVFEKITDDDFFYYWESDSEGREFEYSANADVQPRIEILDESIDPPNTSAALRLDDDYNIVLDNSDQRWTYDLASKLLKAIDSLPHDKLSKKARFTLSDREIDDDIEFERQQGHWIATLSTHAFAYAGDKLVKLNGKQGRFFSRRLFQALVYFFTNNGENSGAIEKILSEKFAVTTRVGNYQRLTGENRYNFQRFHYNELVQIINAFSEMPSGYHKIRGLRYLVRRKDGHPHPLYPEAPAVAWPRGADSDSYIEFMDTAFIGGSEEYMHRLILHEKSHFLWGNIFPKT